MFYVPKGGYSLHKLIILFYNLSGNYMHTGQLHHEIKPKAIQVTGALGWHYLKITSSSLLYCQSKPIYYLCPQNLLMVLTSSEIFTKVRYQAVILYNEISFISEPGKITSVLCAILSYFKFEHNFCHLYYFQQMNKPWMWTVLLYYFKLNAIRSYCASRQWQSCHAADSEGNRKLRKGFNKQMLPLPFEGKSYLFEQAFSI